MDTRTLIMSNDDMRNWCDVHIVQNCLLRSGHTRLDVSLLAGDELSIAYRLTATITDFWHGMQIIHTVKCWSSF